jgi:pantoate--beta-alanine ligase
MRIVTSTAVMQSLAEKLRTTGRRTGFVPTMGYLHEGHLSLIRAAKNNCDDVIVSIFVNPAQFAPNEDFEKYPRDLERDSSLAEKAGADYLFCPSSADMYPDGYASYVAVEGISAVWEGAVRPTHFRGVTTVVMKLLQLTKPHVLYLGQKDVQQCVVLRRMVKDLNIDTEVRICQTVREKDGLAMSSRNVYLSPDDRQKAPVLFRSLEMAAKRVSEGVLECAILHAEIEKLLAAAGGAHVDYIAIVDGDSLEPLTGIDRSKQTIIALAVRFGTTRLIDNCIIPSVQQPAGVQTG